MFARILAVSFVLVPLLTAGARADDRVTCEAGASLASRFIRNNTHFPVRVAVTPPGAPAATITNAVQLPRGIKCPANGAITFLADASTDNGKSYHRVMSRTRAMADGTWTVDVAPDSSNSNFAYTAQFGIMVIPARGRGLSPFDKLRVRIEYSGIPKSVRASKLQRPYPEPVEG